MKDNTDRGNLPSKCKHKHEHETEGSEGCSKFSTRCTTTFPVHQRSLLYLHPAANSDVPCSNLRATAMGVYRNAVAGGWSPGGDPG